MKYLLAIALTLSLTGCALKPSLTLDDALDSYDWAHHTEEEFWNTFPQYRAQYEAEVLSWLQ